MGVSANDDGLCPARDKAGNLLAQNGLTEHRATQNVSDGTVRRKPHLLQLELCREKNPLIAKIFFKHSNNVNLTK